MKHLLLLALFLLASLPARAEPQVGPAPLGADEILSAAFQMDRHLSGFEGALTSRGHLHLSPEDGLIWAVETPFPAITVITEAGIAQGDGAGSLTHLQGSERVAPFLTLIGAVLAGEWDALAESFTIETAPMAGDPKGWTAVLTPRAEGALGGQISRIEARGHALVEAVTLTRPGGDRDEITLGEQILSPPPPPPEVAALFAEAAGGK